MPRCQLDHIVITAPSLRSGVEYVRRVLGAEPQPGGEHARMGTHNALLRLGDDTYLEVIAPNPAAAQPTRPRWFELDSLAIDSAPRLATWVVRTADIRVAAAASPLPLGTIEPMSRGSFEWLITIPADGRLPYGGVAPALTQWTSRPHPATRLDDVGCSLVSLQCLHPEPEQVTVLMAALGVARDCVVERTSPGERPCLIALIRTPDGVREISGA